ncbi:MAG TPA: peptidylprolyl isomerase [Candidatus Peribacteraceae bacterium]|nr:peptidylprolyl isomerase [Candidatus Peribacteraceae bacterium]
MYKFLIPLFALALLISCTPQQNNQNTDSTSSVQSSTDSAMSAMSSPTAMNDSSTNPTGFNGQLLTGKHTVVLKTSKGNITIEVDADAAPKAATNFVTLSKLGYYNGLTFHRVIPGFMIQGGDPNGNGTGGASIFGDTFEDEQNNLTFDRGTVAMANRGPNTNGSQFFITTAATPWLQGHYTIFGKVISGMDTVDAISNVQRDSNDKPLTPVTFTPEVKN